RRVGDATRGGSPFRKDVPGLLRHVGLAEVRLGHGASEEGEAVPQPLLELGPANETKAERQCPRFPRDVVLGRAESARDDQDLGARQRQGEHLRHALEVVSYRLVMDHVDTDLRETLGYPLRVVVADLAQEDLRPY